MPNPHERNLLIRTDSQAACRALAARNVSAALHSALTTHLNAHPNIRVRIQWIPSHTGIRGNEVAHATSRANLPGPPLWWPDPLSLNEQYAFARAERREKLDDLLNNSMKYPQADTHMNRREAVLWRRAQTHSLLSPHFQHYIQGLPGKPACIACGGFPDNAHILWDCPGSRLAIQASLAKLSPTRRPTTLEEWLADSSSDYVRAMIELITTLGLADN